MRHKGFIYKSANRYAGLVSRYPGIDIDDLVQEGSLGLANAASKFQASRNAQFISYASKYVKGAVINYVNECLTTVRVPDYQRQKIRTLEAINSERISKRMPVLTTAETAELFSIPESGRFDATTAANIGRWMLQTTHMGSLDRGYAPHLDHSLGNDYVVDESSNIESLTGGAVDTVEDVLYEAEKDFLDQVLAVLGEKERAVIELRFGFGSHEPRTLEEVGNLYGVKKERIRQIEARALEKMREEMLILTRARYPYRPHLSDVF